MTTPPQRRLRSSPSRLWLAATLAASLPLTDVMAQGLEEIVVTTRKREENLQDVPLSITALTATDFARRGIDDLEGVSDFTAGLNFEDFSTTFNGALTLRGLTQADIQNRVQNVSAFLDGLYIPRNYSVDLGLMDLERIEVVKGPQSALYGQNAFAGAINYVSVKPSLTDIEAKASLTVGTAGRLDYKGSVSFPVVEDKLAIRAAYGSSEFNGNRKNDFPNVSKKYEKLGGFDNESYNVAMLAQPSDELRVEAMYMRTKRDSEVRPGYTASGNTTAIALNCGPTVPATGNPSFWCGKLPKTADPMQSATSSRPSGILFPDQPGSEIDTEIIRGALTYDITDDLSFNYIYGNVDASAQEISALVDNPTAGVFTYQKEGGINKFHSHEARLSYQPDAPYSFEAGYYNAKTADDFVFNLGLAFGSPTLKIVDNTTGPLDTTGLAIPLRSFRIDETTNAVFGSAQFKFADDRARLSVEARQSWVDITNLDKVANRGTQSDTYKNFTPRVTVEYDATDETMLYASMARGAKAGGFNGFVAGPVTLLPNEQTFAPEKNWTYELGAKNTFWDGRWVLNAAAYYVDWTQMQIVSLPGNFDTSIITPGTVAPTIFLNVGDVKNWGLELEGSVAFTDQFSMNYAFSTSDPKFRDGTKWGQFVGVCDGVFCPADGEVGGKTISRQSRHQAAIGAQWEDLAFDDVEYFVRADLTYKSKQYVDALNLAWTDARTNVNASLGLTGPNWSVTGWVENLFDKTYVTNSFFIIQFRRYGPTINDGRTAGVTFTVNY